MIINALSLGFSYGNGKEVLKDVTFTLRSESMTVLLGRNGAGKSTLFRLMLKSLMPKNGVITVDGISLDSIENRNLAKVFSYIPQSSYMEFSYTVLDTILMASSSRLSLFSSPGKKEREEARALLALFNIESLCDRTMENLSGGERQLVLIARAMMQKASFIILDEPTSNLDYGNQLMVLETLERLNREGIGIIYSTHNPELALSYASSILILDKGMISSYDSPEKLVESETLQKLYGKNLYIDKVFTGENERYVCIPK